MVSNAAPRTHSTPSGSETRPKAHRHGLLLLRLLLRAHARHVVLAHLHMGNVGCEIRGHVTAPLLHLDEVERAVEAARQVRRVDRERELLVQQIEPAMVRKQAV